MTSTVSLVVIANGLRLIRAAPSARTATHGCSTHSHLFVNDTLHQTGTSVFDGNAKRVDTGSPLRAGRNTVAVTLNPGPANGTYTVSWSVLSADGHPIDGGCPRLHWTGGEIIL